MNKLLSGRRKFLVISVMVVTAAVLVACMPVQPVAEIHAQPEREIDLEEVTAAINEVWAEYSAANVASDAERYMAVWADNPIKMGPGKLPVEGKEAILAGKIAGFEKTDYLDMVITSLEVGACSDWAYSRGVYTATLEPVGGGEQRQVDGKFMTIFQKQPDGSWKIYRDIYNSNVP